MKFDIKKKEGQDIRKYKGEDMEIAYEFAKKTYKEFGSFLKASRRRFIQFLLFFCRILWILLIITKDLFFDIFFSFKNF